MKICGIEIDKNKANISILDTNGTEANNFAKQFQQFKLADHEDATQVRALQKELSQFLKTQEPDQIAIIRRGTKGRFAASVISFKIEGLIQLHPQQIEYIAPQTLRAFYKGETLAVEAKHKYEIKSLELAYYLLLKTP